jgi:hypothetical protein
MGQQDREEQLDDVMEQYKVIRECLTGLYDIMNISFSEQNIMHQAAIDNLKTLNKAVIDMLGGSFTPREIRIRLRELEFDEKEAEEVFPL